ncbi:DgyrCDS4276 [Dimorphilus gyrociliatus]|uniref:DgyrCDS4276 n=1 Tax=Dimorphilus gyrociliatus TaxID=2664684 RepID=A0A7I8VGH2_9ANNE|nr:DgyrCDS4276 [Dimorphilus gyrociliatus]
MIVVIQPGSTYLRIGRSSDHSPLMIHHCIARRHKKVSQKKEYFNYYRESVTDKENTLQDKERGIAYAESLLASKYMSNNSYRQPTSIKKHTSANQNEEVCEISSQKSSLTDSCFDKEPEYIVGSEALLLSPDAPYNIHWPVKCGRLNLHSKVNGGITGVQSDLTDIWKWVLENPMKLTPEERRKSRVVVVVPDIFERIYISTIVGILLDQLEFTEVFLHQEAVCSALGVGVISACVIDMGDQKTSITCVDDGIALRNSRLTLEVGGSDISLIWHWLLRKLGLPWDQFDWRRYDHFLQLQSWKEQFCTLDLDDHGSHLQHLHLNLPNTRLKKFHLLMGDERLLAPMAVFSPSLFSKSSHNIRIPSKLPSNCSDDPFDDVFVQQSQIRGPGAGSENTKKAKKKMNTEEDLVETHHADDEDSCDVVDTQSVHSFEVGNSNLAAVSMPVAMSGQSGPGRPPKPKITDDYDPITLTDFPSLPQAIALCIGKCETEELRRKMWSNIVLVGGGLLFPGASNFLQQSLWPLLPAHLQLQPDSLEVLSHPKDVDARLVAWKAATVLCCLDSAQELWISRTEWQDFGTRIIRERVPFVWSLKKNPGTKFVKFETEKHIKHGKLFTVNYDNILKSCNAAEQFETYDPIMMEGLDKCLPALADNNDLRPMGRILHCYRIQAALKSRASIRKYLSLNPEINSEPVNRPVFIIGLPRTGTTHLFNLLSQDRRFKAPLTWEMNFPVPPPLGNESSQDSRVKATKSMFETLVKIYPSIKYTHDLQALSPEEDVWILERCGIFSEFEYYFNNTEEYSNWYKYMDEAKMIARYHYYKQELQCIGKNYDMKQRHWLIKCRLHLFWLRSLLKVFPDAVLVWTHRPLQKCVPSYCSLEYIFSEVQQIDLPNMEAYRKRVCKHLSDLANEGKNKLEKELGKKASPFYDIQFNDLCRNPQRVLEDFYNYLGWDISKELQKKFDSYLQNNPKDKHGVHNYSMQEFGIDEKMLTEEFSNYMDYHKKLF